MQTGGRNRAAIIAVGGWGARVVAHLWPRLRMADRGRALTPILVPPSGMASWGASSILASSNTRLPRLSDMVSHALILPDEDGSITIARPQPERWDDVSFARRRLPHLAGGLARRIASNGDTVDDSDGQQSVRILRRKTHHALWPTLDIVGRYEVTPAPAENREQPPSRREMWQFFQDHRLDIATDLAAIVELARVDESTPNEEASQLTLFVVASLADELATAILWPLVQLLRERIGGHVLAELVGLLSTGVYAPPQERRREEAAVHVAIHELAQLIGQQMSAGAPDEIVAPPFDRTYLIDREKLSGALVRDESELTTVVGNALEAFLAADANIYLRNALAPDAADLLRIGPYSSLGAACIYVPLEEMWTQARQRLALDMLRDHFLAPLPEEVAQQAGELADRFLQKELDPSHLSGKLLEERGMVTAQPADQFASGRGQAYRWRAPRPDQDQAGEPVLQVKVPVMPLRDQPGAPDQNASRTSRPGDLAVQAKAINNHFDAIEAGQFEEWATALAERSVTLAGNDNGQRSLLQRLDDEIVALLTTHEQGLAAASVYVARIISYLNEQQEKMSQQRLRWQRAAEANKANSPVRRAGSPTRLEESLARLDRNPLLRRLPSWPVALGGLSLLALALSALAMLTGAPDGLLGQGGQMAASAVFAWSLAIAAGVYAVGIVFWLAYRRWLQGSLDRVIASRQDRLNYLAQAHLADALARFFGQLAADIARRQKALETATERLRRDRDSLADRISEPLALSHSFVRQPLAQEELYADIRSQPVQLPSEDLASQVFRSDAASMEMVRQGWKRSVHYAYHAAGNLSGSATPGGLPGQDGAMPAGAPINGLAEAMSLAVERYAARLSQPEAPADVNVEDLLPRVMPGYSPSDFLADLRMKAKPLIHLDDQIVTMPISIDLMASPLAGASQPASPVSQAGALRLHLLSSYDPFSLILVRTLHGVPLEAIGSLRAYADSFANLGDDERSALSLAPQPVKQKRAPAKRRSAPRRKAASDPSPSPTLAKASGDQAAQA